MCLICKELIGTAETGRRGLRFLEEAAESLTLFLPVSVSVNARVMLRTLLVVLRQGSSVTHTGHIVLVSLALTRLQCFYAVTFFILCLSDCSPKQGGNHSSGHECVCAHMHVCAPMCLLLGSLSEPYTRLSLLPWFNTDLSIVIQATSESAAFEALNFQGNEVLY